MARAPLISDASLLQSGLLLRWLTRIVNTAAPAHRFTDGDSSRSIGFIGQESHFATAWNGTRIVFDLILMFVTHAGTYIPLHNPVPNKADRTKLKAKRSPITFGRC